MSYKQARKVVYKMLEVSSSSLHTSLFTLHSSLFTLRLSLFIFTRLDLWLDWRDTNMGIIKIMKVLYVVFPFLFFFFVSSQDCVVHGRVLSIPNKPDPNDAAATARWLISQNSWGVLNTISADLGGAPFGNVASYSDGLPNEGSGIPYFYMTTFDPTTMNALKDPRSSLTVSEYPLGTCGKTDPENPTCSKITLTGKLKVVDAKSEEAEIAMISLISKHAEMKGWPKDHNFQVFKLEIENIFLIDWFGGPKPLTVEQYLHPKNYYIRNQNNKLGMVLI